VNAVAVFADFVVAGSSDGTINTWDTNRRPPPLERTLSGDEAYGVDKLAVFADGKRVVTAGKDVKIWNMESGEELHVPNLDIFTCSHNPLAIRKHSKFIHPISLIPRQSTLQGWGAAICVPSIDCSIRTPSHNEIRKHSNCIHPTPSCG
jgi:WD40 repeat protein